MFGEATNAEVPSNVRVVSSLRPDDEGFTIEDRRTLRALSRAEDGHFWHRSRNAFIEGRLRALGVAPDARVLELGCGGGSVAAHLSHSGFRVTGVDGHLPRIREAASRAPAARFVVHDLSRGVAELGFREPFDVVGLFDVIEHLDTPREALEGAVSCVRPGGFVVGTVPALMALWTKVDEHARHRLRYERRGLTELLESVPGTSLAEVLDFNRHLVPMMWLHRKMVASDDRSDTAEKNLQVPSAPVNQVMLSVARLERKLDRVLRRAPLPGASLWFAIERAAG